MKEKIMIILVTSLTTFTVITSFIGEIPQTQAASTVTTSDKMRTGSVEIFTGSSIPSGYLLCDGRAVSRTTYADLFKVIGTTYGAGDGSTTFNLPDFTGRLAVGKNSGTFNSLGKKGGEETHKMTASEIPSHTHSIPPLTGTTNTAGEHRHGIGQHNNSGSFTGQAVSYPNQVQVGYQDANLFCSEEGAHSHTATSNASTTGACGSGNAMNNLQPYIVVNYIIKY